MRPLEDYLSRPLTPPDPSLLAAIEQPIDSRQAQPADDVEVLLDSSELPGESGWCVLSDGCGYVAIRTEMPGVTGEMIDWSWADASDDERYASWPTDRMREMEHLATGIQLADENLGVRPAPFVSDDNLSRLDTLRAKYDPDGRFHSWMGRPSGP